MYFNVLVYFQEILDRTGYSLDVTTGQRKYGGPPPDMDESSQPGAGHEVGGFIQLKILMYWKKTLFWQCCLGPT